tara:strand:- start:1161 stop:1640 length:480 start_codon:yes stop_codon:yes gene_type:complete
MPQTGKHHNFLLNATVMSKQTLVYTKVEKMGLLVHSKNAPDATEWDAFFEAIKTDVLGKKVKSLLVYSDGGAPQHNQRSKLTGLTAFQEIPTQVVLDPGIHWDQAGNRVGAYNWAYNKEVFAHAPEELAGAVSLLGIEDSETIKTTLEELKTSLATSAE